MKNINKTLLAVVLAASALSLGACNQGGSEPDPTPVINGTTLPDIIVSRPDTSKIESMSVNRKVLSLQKDSNAQLQVSCLPVRKETPKYIFTSSDEKIATVDENGVVTAVGPWIEAGVPVLDENGKPVLDAQGKPKTKDVYHGEAVISVESPDKSIKIDVPVYTYANDLTPSKANSIATKMRKAQSSINKLKSIEYIESTDTKDGVVTSYQSVSETLTVSVEDAYFAIEEIDCTAKVAGGNLVRDEIKYIFYTNEGFNTYIFKIQGNVRNYLALDTTSFMASSTRYDALLAVVSNFFTSGSKIVTDLLDDALGKDAINSIKSGDFFGSNTGENDLFFHVVSKGTYPADQDDEDGFGIPVGTSYNVNYGRQYTFKDNYCLDAYIDQTLTWENKGVACSNRFIKDSTYLREGFELEYPDKSLFNPAADIFEL